MLAETCRPAPPAALKWRRAVLVCGDCEARKDGPRHLSAKDARRELKHAMGDEKSRLRVVVTGCLGPCESKALTVVALGAGEPVGFAVCRRDQLSGLLHARAAQMTTPSTQPARAARVSLADSLHSAFATAERVASGLLHLAA